MKVILTESQLRLIKEDALIELMRESLMEDTSIGKMVEKLKAAVVAGAISLPLAIVTINKLPVSDFQKECLRNQIENIRRENIRLSSLRATLLPKLMSGEIDVSAVQL